MFVLSFLTIWMMESKSIAPLHCQLVLLLFILVVGVTIVYYDKTSAVQNLNFLSDNFLNVSQCVFIHVIGLLDVRKSENSAV